MLSFCCKRRCKCNTFFVFTNEMKYFFLLFIVDIILLMVKIITFERK